MPAGSRRRNPVLSNKGCEVGFASITGIYSGIERHSWTTTPFTWSLLDGALSDYPEQDMPRNLLLACCMQEGAAGCVG
jgi:hypothetical protein